MIKNKLIDGHFDSVGEQVGLKLWEHSVAHLVVLIDGLPQYLIPF
jgi:hypothetical protein